MTVADANQAASPRLVFICVPGLSRSHLPSLSDTATRSVRSLSVRVPRTDAALIADLATGVDPLRHGIGADSVWDSDLEAFRPPDSTDLKTTPVWEIAARYGRSTCVIGTSLASVFGVDSSALPQGLTCLECTDGQVGSTHEPPSAELNETSLREILGDRLVECLGGSPGRERRAACDAVDALRSVLRVHEAATARLQTHTDELVAAVYAGFGPLLRSGIVDQDRVAAFVAMLCGRVHELVGAEASVLIVGGPTLPDGVIAEQGGATTGGTGVMLLLGPGGQPLTSEPSSRDVLPTVLDLIGVPQAIDSPGTSTTRVEGQRQEAVFTHEVGERSRPQTHHREQPSIDRIAKAGYLCDSTSPAQSQLLRNEACLASFEIAEGRVPPWKPGNEIDVLKLPAPLLVAAAASAAQRRDAVMLQQIVGAMSDKGFERVFIEAVRATLAEARADSDGIAAAIGNAESLLETQGPTRELATAAVAMSCEHVGRWESGARLWERYAQSANSNRAATNGWLGVARCSLRRRELNCAADAARNALALNPNDTQAGLILGTALLWLRDAGGAEEALQTALRRCPASQPVRRLLVRVLRRLGRHDEASELERSGSQSQHLDDVSQW